MGTHRKNIHKLLNMSAELKHPMLLRMMYYGHLPHFLLIECDFVTRHGWPEQEEDYCLVYFLKVRGDHQRFTPNELWELWEKEADVALKAKAEGRIVAL
jgi:hypothetical protein